MGFGATYFELGANFWTSCDFFWSLCNLVRLFIMNSVQHFLDSVQHGVTFFWVCDFFWTLCDFFGVCGLFLFLMRLGATFLDSVRLFLNLVQFDLV